MTAEGANQSVRGDGEDNAGNTAFDVVGGINIDKTPPEIVSGILEDCTLWPANHKMVTVTTVVC